MEPVGLRHRAAVEGGHPVTYLLTFAASFVGMALTLRELRLAGVIRG